MTQVIGMTEWTGTSYYLWKGLMVRPHWNQIYYKPSVSFQHKSPTPFPIKVINNAGDFVYCSWYCRRVKDRPLLGQRLGVCSKGLSLITYSLAFVAPAPSPYKDLCVTNSNYPNRDLIIYNLLRITPKPVGIWETR